MLPATAKLKLQLNHTHITVLSKGSLNVKYVKLFGSPWDFQITFKIRNKKCVLPVCSLAATTFTISCKVSGSAATRGLLLATRKYSNNQAI